jgi:hypothetical protein
MSYRKTLFLLCFVGLVLWIVQEASAAVPPFPTGGTIRGPRKQAANNTDLICDLNDAASNVKFTTFPSLLEPNVAPRFDMSGLVRCWEIPAGGTPNQVVTPPGKGLFLLTQATVLDQLNPGFDYTQTGPCSPLPAAGCERTWTFSNDASDANVLFELLAVDGAARAQCPEISQEKECKVYFGLQDAFNPAGEVIRFQTKTVLQGLDLREVPVGDVTFRLCHNLQFNAVQTFVVDAFLNSSTGGTSINTGISFNAGDRLIISVDPKSPNIWNAGVNRTTGVNNCDPFCRWSTAAGLIRNFLARDDDGPTPAESSAAISGEPAGTLIGVNWPETHTQSGLTAAFGTLVGKIGNTYFPLGTDFNGLAPASGVLELVYWDSNNFDNEGSVTVQVLKDSPILCQVPGTNESTESVADIRGFQPVEVKAFPIFDLSKVSAKLRLPYPLTVVACTAGDNEIGFARNGAPIKPDAVLVNNVEVDVKAFTVLNTVHTHLAPLSPCDPTKKAADLNLLLDYTDFRAAIAPGGQCTNGPVTFNATFHDRSEPPGFYAGEATVKLTNCPN